MERGLAARVAGVAVEGGPGDEAAGAAREQVGRVLRLGLLPWRSRVDVALVHRPVVVVAEDLRVDPGLAERPPDRDDQLCLLRHGQVHAGIATRVAVLRLVLHRHGVHRHAGPLVVLDELDEVARVGGVDAGIVDQPSADQRPVRLHPCRRAPWRADHLQPRVERQRLAQERQDLRTVVRDREAAHVVVRLARRQVVVGVEVAGHEVRRAHRLAQERQAVAVGRAEQAPHGGVAGPAIEPIEHVGRGVRDRGAEAVHRLVRAARVDADREVLGAAGSELGRAAIAQFQGPVGRRDPHVCGRRRGHGGRGHGKCECDRQNHCCSVGHPGPSLPRTVLR